MPLFSKRVRSHRVEDPESDLPDPTKFGEQVAIDHMIVSKSSGGREFVVLLVYETFNGILTVYPASSKSSRLCIHMSQALCWPAIPKSRHCLHPNW